MAPKNRQGTPEDLPWLTADDNPAPEVCVVGDVMLDEYMDGTVTRISPEAPVPIHRARSVSRSPGGAGNVARNIVAAGGRAQLVGVIGDDEAGSALRTLLEQDGISAAGLMVVQHRSTTRKTRVTSQKHQLIRIDWDDAQPLHERDQAAILEKVGKLSAQVLVLSDYGKGVLPAPLSRSILGLCRARNIPTVVDPKGLDYSRYQGAFVITPNRLEATLALGLDPAAVAQPSAAELARGLQERFGLRNVLVTLGADGMFLRDERGQERHLPAQAREVFDVSGAGDTVVAVLSLGLGAGVPLADCLPYANAAGGRAVEKAGTQAVSAAEIREAMTANNRERQPCSTPNQPKAGCSKSASKVVDLAYLEQALPALQRAGQRIVFTNGCFDLLHAGHVDYLERARALGDLLVVGINSDASVKRLKGPGRPIHHELHRQRVIAALAAVDYVISFGDDTPLALIRALQPDVLVKGADYQADGIVGADLVKARGGRVCTVPLTPDLSTTLIVEKIQAGEVI